MTSSSTIQSIYLQNYLTTQLLFPNESTKGTDLHLSLKLKESITNVPESILNKYNQSHFGGGVGALNESLVDENTLDIKDKGESMVDGSRVCVL